MVDSIEKQSCDEESNSKCRRKSARKVEWCFGVLLSPASIVPGRLIGLNLVSAYLRVCVSAYADLGGPGCASRGVFF